MTPHEQLHEQVDEFLRKITDVYNVVDQMSELIHEKVIEMEDELRALNSAMRRPAVEETE